MAQKIQKTNMCQLRLAPQDLINYVPLEVSDLI